MIISAIRAYLGADYNTYLPGLLVILATTVAWTYVKDQFLGYFTEHFTSSVTIRTDDEIFNMVMFWLSKQPFAHNSRHFVANINVNSRHRAMYSYNSDDERDTDDDGVDSPVEAATGQSNSKKQVLHYTPDFGTHYFWYKYRLLTFERVVNKESNYGFLTSSEKEQLRISCLGRSPNILKELVLDAREMYMTKDDRKTVIFRANLIDNYWQRCMSRLNRPFSTVILKEEVKQDLIDDVADYVNPVTRRWYANRGIPYRRGYLLHGPPGTGKSSLSLALAGFFRMKIYMVSLSSHAATEESLTALFHELPTRCVVLLEDIDSAGLTHTRESSTTSPEPAASESASSSTNPVANLKARMQPPPASGRLSLSGLLNILDGVASQEGRILIMTTNHMEKLDKALIRPGRIDMIINFGLADSHMSAAIFRAIYTPYENETSPRKGAVDPDQEAIQAGLAKKRAKITERVDEQAKLFGERTPELEFSPAEIQGLLLKHKRDPEAALAAVGSWVAQMRKDKKEKAVEAEKAKQEEERIAKEEEEKNRKEEDAEKKASDTDKDDAKPGQDTTLLKAEEIKAKTATGEAADGSKKSASDSGYETP
jgi:chaperone BCS1